MQPLRVKPGGFARQEVKEFTYNNLDEYLDKADKYEDPKIIKIVEMSAKEESNLYNLKAMVYLRTALLCWEGKGGLDVVKELLKELKQHGHAEGRVVEVTGLKF